MPSSMEGVAKLEEGVKNHSPSIISLILKASTIARL